MAICATCRQPNDDASQYCRNCGHRLSAAPLAAAVPPSAPLSTAGRAGGIIAQGKSPLFAVLLSLFLPGLGQLYNGDLKKGFVLVLVWCLSIMLALGSMGTLAFVPLILVIWGAVDAYNVAAQNKPLWA